MGYFETFHIKLRDKKGGTVYRLKTLDSEQIESWELVDNKHTKVTMRSGDTFVLHIDIQTFGDIIINYEDAYGKILVFSQN
jgi:hypothetical protein